MCFPLGSLLEHIKGRWIGHECFRGIGVAGDIALIIGRLTVGRQRPTVSLIDFGLTGTSSRWAAERLAAIFVSAASRIYTDLSRAREWV